MNCDSITCCKMSTTLLNPIRRQESFPVLGLPPLLGKFCETFVQHLSTQSRDGEVPCTNLHGKIVFDLSLNRSEVLNLQNIWNQTGIFMNLTESFPQSVKTVHGVKKCHLQGATTLNIQTPNPRSQLIKFLEDFVKIRSSQNSFCFRSCNDSVKETILNHHMRQNFFFALNSLKRQL